MDTYLSYTEAGLVLTALPAGGLLGHAFTPAPAGGGRRAGGGGLPAGRRRRRLIPGAGGRLLPLILVSGTSLALLTHALVFLPLVPLEGAAAAGFGVAGAAFYSVLQATVLRLRPGQAGTTDAAVSTIGMFDVAVPPLAGRIADARGLSVGLGLYAAIALLTALLALTAAPFVRGGRSNLPAAATAPENGADVGRAG